jgi:hypothetical protein
VVAVRRKETGHWGGVRGRHERTPTRLGSGLGLGRAGTGFASRYEDGDGLAGLHCFGWGRLPAEFRPIANVNIENSFFLFPNLFIICKLIRIQFKFEF